MAIVECPHCKEQVDLDPLDEGVVDGECALVVCMHCDEPFSATASVRWTMESAGPGEQHWQQADGISGRFAVNRVGVIFEGSPTPSLFHEWLKGHPPYLPEWLAERERDEVDAVEQIFAAGWGRVLKESVAVRTRGGDREPVVVFGQQDKMMAVIMPAEPQAGFRPQDYCDVRGGPVSIEQFARHGLEVSRGRLAISEVAGSVH